MLVAFSNVSEPEYIVHWKAVNQKWSGATHLLHLFEEYLVTLATSFESTKTPAFDAITDNTGTLRVNELVFHFCNRDILLK